MIFGATFSKSFSLMRLCGAGCGTVKKSHFGARPE
jgi:hypothetical protein